MTNTSPRNENAHTTGMVGRSYELGGLGGCDMQGISKTTASPIGSIERVGELERVLRGMGRVAVAFSGGVDSTFLAAVCARAIPRRTVLIHLDTPFVGTPEREAYLRTVGQLGLPYISLPLDPLAREAVAANPSDRCYHCKRACFETIMRMAEHLRCSTVLEGSNADDLHDFRPGMRAAGELGARSPLAELGWSKDEERELLRVWGFDVWGMPAGACLATRVATGERITAAKLDAIRACEDHLHAQGLAQVRVRLNNGTARVYAAPDELELLATGADGTRCIAPAGRDGGTRSSEPCARGNSANGNRADAAPSTPLSPGLLAQLKQLGNGAFNTVDPLARPYRSGGGA